MRMQGKAWIWSWIVLLAAIPARGQDLDGLIHTMSGSSERSSSSKLLENGDAISLSPGETRVLADLEGPGKITHIWMTIFSEDLRYPRSVVLRMYWDGATVPSVETPVGDFFGCGNGMKADINSLPVKVSSYGRAYNCYWVMPFRTRARITISNESGMRTPSCYYMIDWRKLERAPDDLMYFHARYHQEYPVPIGEPYTVFEGRGNGHYVGSVLSSQAAHGHWYGEGDDFWYIDGAATPTLAGCGTEDYFNDAWNMRVHSGPYTGCTVFEPRGVDWRVTAYRWHIPDPVIFKKSLKFTMERAGFILDEMGRTIDSFKPRPDKWSSVAFWYQDAVAEPWCAFPPLRERVDPEVFYHLPKIKDRIAHSDRVVLEEMSYNRPCFNRQGLLVRNDLVGSWIELPFEIREEGSYIVSLFQLLREDNGIWKVFIDGRELYEAGESQIPGGYRIELIRSLKSEQINKTLDFFNIYRKNEQEDITYGQNIERKIGLFRFAPGEHRLKLVCIGSNPLARNPETGKPYYNLTADILSVRKIPFENIDQWLKDMIEHEKAKAKLRR